MGNNGKMKINVKFLASIREIAGAHEMQFELNSGYTVKTSLNFWNFVLERSLKKRQENPSRTRIPGKIPC